MQLNVPLIADAQYLTFLAGLGERVHCVHYSLHDPVLNDARIRLRTAEMESIIGWLQALPGPRKYLLANGRFHRPECYAEIVEDNALQQIVRRLRRLFEAGVLDGVIFSDAYLLLALSDADPQLAAQIEAVPSVNFMIDSAPKLAAVFNLIGQSRFRPPGKITLDRGLNRMPKALADLATVVRTRCPATKIELLANEGCLDQCPYRPTHEALIAAANTGLAFDTFRLNRDLGCMRLLNRSPHRILASPFIRPEDIHRFEGIADIIKVCGRTPGKAFLGRAVGAYAEGAYHGNLLELLDAAHWMAERWDLANNRLPDSFFDRVTTCSRFCHDCTGCRDLWRQSARAVPFRLKDLRESA